MQDNHQSPSTTAVSKKYLSHIFDIILESYQIITNFLRIRPPLGPRIGGSNRRRTFMDSKGNMPPCHTAPVPFTILLGKSSGGGR